MIAQGYLDRYEHAEIAPVVAPLLSQPIIELCLRIPARFWVEGGQNRAMARQAFADRLPPLLANRKTKGGLSSLVATITGTHLEILSRRLQDGRLAQAGLLDRAGLAQALNAPGSISSIDQFRILQIADIEAWVRTWTDRSVASA